MALNKQMEMFEDGGLSTAKDDAMEKLDSGVKELRADRKQQFDKMTEMLNSGKVNDMTLEQKENFVQLYKMLKQHHNFAKGGMLEDGGLMDEGGSIDPVSGNDVPPGSTQEEVRDDIPAQLSEGEFVFPADVVRYIGLGNLMRMRQEAKMGLRVMDEMGQMGNSEEATMPDDLPFDINDLDMEDEIEDNNELEMQVGGFVQPTQQQQQMGISGYQQAAAPTTGVAAVPQQAASQQYVQPVQPVQAAVPTMQAYKPSEVPTFQQTIGDDAFGSYDELRQYRNEAGNIINVPFRNGQPISPIPEGYTFVDPEATETEEVTTTPTTPQTTSVREEPEGDAGVGQGGAFGDMETMQNRIDLAKKMGVTEMTGVFEGIGGTIGTFGKDSVGKMTGTGYIIGEGGQLLDPLTGTLVKGGDTSLSPLNIISGAFDDKYNKQTPYGEAYFDALPSSIKDVMGVQMGGQARKDRISEAKTKQEKYKSDLEFEKESFGKSNATVRNEERKKKAEEIAQTTNKIKQAQAKARAEMRAKEDAAATAARISREQSEIASGQYQDSGGNDTTAQEASDDYTASAVSEAVSTGDYSRGFNEGGLASKPKPKTKKMKKGGLASKK